MDRSDYYQYNGERLPLSFPFATAPLCLGSANKRKGETATKAGLGPPISLPFTATATMEKKSSSKQCPVVNNV